ncbi:GNAT family N-acetyltransferase [Pseudomonas leptonychotis]|uniref:GNAT family N-acetyltransferase n=1 Tax=Pseudomonas leptonychotis TaxID=2448482 RepID=UPI0038630A89
MDAKISSSWPSGEYDRDAMEFFLSRLEEGGESAEGWYGWYALGSETPEGSRTLIGAAGYHGPPDSTGTVEIGYSVLPEWQNHGYASEMVKLLVTHALSFEGVSLLVAHTRIENPASIAVLSRCGFVPAGAGLEPDSMRFEHHRVGGT